MRRASKRWIRLWALLVPLALIAGCRQAQRPGADLPRGRSIVLISIDTLRSDRLPAYGYSKVATPAIDALRSDAVLFEHAYTPIPLTLAAHSSIFTGKLPPAHGVRDNVGYRLTPAAGKTLAERLEAAGYATGGAVSAFVLRHQTGIARGFDFYDDGLKASPTTFMSDIQRPGDETLAAALSWLDSVKKRPFFLFFHIYEPHLPRTPPEPFASRYADPYDGEVAAADAVIGHLVEALRKRGLYDGSTVLLLSDHGEGLGDHGEEDHGLLIYRDTLQVPMLLKLPGAEFRGGSVATPVELTDVAPTLIDLAGLPAADGLPGTSLVPLAAGAPPSKALANRVLYSESFDGQIRFGWAGLRSVIRGHYHYIEGVDRELYDLAADPGETHNLIREDRRTYAALRDALAGFASQLKPPFEEQAETRNALAALGYLGSSAAASEGPRLDPKTQLHKLVGLNKGIALALGQLGKDREAEAIPLLEEATRNLPHSVDAWQFLGLAYQKTGQPEKAVDAYQEAFRVSNGEPQLAKPLAYLTSQLRRWKDAVVFTRLAVEHDPDKLDLRLLQVRALLFAGRLDEALAAAQETVERFPKASEAHHLLGAVRMGRRELKPAEAELRRAVELDPRNTAALSDLAVLLGSQGRRAEAQKLIERLRRIQAQGHAGA